MARGGTSLARVGQAFITPGSGITAASRCSKAVARTTASAYMEHPVMAMRSGLLWVESTGDPQQVTTASQPAR